ncbi:MAG: 3-hydroxyacyl-ACP dehydratase FabZ [Alphaproteobacteria bacterium]|nr:3-hydroxyacyl-ACP dehydratase FabZ [Alphaproteobacteria bacterium]
MPDQAAESALDVLDIHRIMELIPHRYPFLLIDRIVDIVPDVSCTGIKNVTINEPHFQGHFPSQPVFPGVLLIEAMAQTAGALVVHSIGSSAVGKLVYFLSVDSCRFRKPVVPGDQLRIHVDKRQRRGNVWKFDGEAKVDGVLVAEAVVTAMLTDDE